jgi:hypothetical protein
MLTYLDDFIRLSRKIESMKWDGGNAMMARQVLKGGDRECILPAFVGRKNT